MKTDHSGKIFVFLVFVVVAAVILKGVNISGNAVATQAPVLEKVGEFDSSRFYFDISQDFNYEVPATQAGSIIYAVDASNKYSIRVLRVYENYELSDQHVTLLVSPGDKRITLTQGQSEMVDFDNDQRADVKVSLVSVTGPEARLVFSQP